MYSSIEIVIRQPQIASNESKKIIKEYMKNKLHIFNFQHIDFQ